MASINVSAAVLRQNGRELYCFGMNSAMLRRLCYVTPRSQENPEEIQRIVDSRRAKEIGEYLKQSNSLLPNALVVSFTSDVSIRPSGNPQVATITFPDEAGKFAYILDGQHRLEGFRHSEGVEFDLPVVAIHNADDSLRGKIFADINSKQVRVSDVHLLSLYYQIKELPVDETPVLDVIMRLNADLDSPLKNHIQMETADKGKWVKNTALRQWLAPHLTTGGVLANKTVAEKTTIIKHYFTAIQKTWPDAWGNRKDYNLCKPIGFEIMLGLFAPIKYRCDLNAGRQYTPQTFAQQMKPLTSAVLELPGGGRLDLNWQVGPMGILSNKATRTMIVKKLSDDLRQADETT